MRQYLEGLIPILVVLACNVLWLSSYRSDAFGCDKALEAGLMIGAQDLSYQESTREFCRMSKKLRTIMEESFCRQITAT